MSAVPESNVDIVALNLVMNAVVDDVMKPGDALAELFDRMATMARNIGGDHRIAMADWQELLDNFSDSEVESVMRRQEFAFCEAWAQRWLLCQMVKFIHSNLENDCLKSSAASAIESVIYNNDGTVESWKIRQP